MLLRWRHLLLSDTSASKLPEHGFNIVAMLRTDGQPGNVSLLCPLLVELHQL